MPGRIVGKTTDRFGKDAYVLTLQPREQHIKRERALSNICSNQALCALRAATYLATMGGSGVYKAAYNSFQNAHFAAAEFEKVGLKVLRTKIRTRSSALWRNKAFYRGLKRAAERCCGALRN